MNALGLCSQALNATIGNTNITWAQAVSNTITTLAATSYLRPDSGGALLPWVYTIGLIILHIPVVCIRVSRWEAVHYWCLASTFFTIVIYTQAYISAQFDAGKVLVWTPLVLVIDAGSMLQVIFLIIEAKKEAAADDPQLNKIPWYRNLSNYTAFVAALLFIAVLVLQLLGLVKAARAVGASSEPPLVPWCSPLFQPLGKAVVDGSCNVYEISQSTRKGLGCILLPGHWQQQWLKGTIAGIVIELFTELIDLLILTLVNGKRKIFQEVKMKRPWATIFSGLVVLIVTLIYGINYSLDLPPGITSRVTVLTDFQGPASYIGELTSAGLRGTIIGWTDGVFEGWKSTYYGSWSAK